MKNNIFLVTMTVLMFSYEGFAADRNPFIPQLPEEEIIEKVESTRHEIQEQTESTIPISTQTERIDKVVPKPEPELPEFEVSGIVWNSDRPQAIINGEVLDVGDIIEDARIIAINKNEIFFTFADKTFTLTYN